MFSFSISYREHLAFDHSFASWSSTRDPHHVFTLLESLYGAFDKIALRRHVFKVETIGDCYNAATGLPKPQRNHAIIMARFAGDIREKANAIFRDAELTLGPGTGDLMLRIGLHSGAVTGKLLCSSRSSFHCIMHFDT